MFCFCGGFLYKSNKSHYIKLFIFRYVSLITGNFKIAFDNTGAVSSTYSLERPRTTDLFPRKSKGGANIATMLVISRGPWVIGKTMVWATKVVGRGVVNDVFKNDHYMGFLLRKYRENGQNHTFRSFEPPKWPFLC